MGKKVIIGILLALVVVLVGVSGYAVRGSLPAGSGKAACGGSCCGTAPAAPAAPNK